MRIGILSDTHDQVARTGRAVALLVAGGAEALVHCGDLTGPAVVRECGGLPAPLSSATTTSTNEGSWRRCSPMAGPAWGEAARSRWDGQRSPSPTATRPPKLRRLAAGSPDYLLFGHTHVKADERHGATRWINPGALHRARSWTVALLDLEDDRLVLLEVP